MSLSRIAARRAPVGIVALAGLAGLAGGLALAPGGTSVTTTRAITAEHTTTVVVSQSAGTRTVAARPRGAEPVSASRAASPAPRGTAAQQLFAGEGSHYLGNVRVGAAGTVHWRSTGTQFRVLFGNGIPAIDSTRHSGQTFVPAGTYYQVRVQADGHWAMRIG